MALKDNLRKILIINLGGIGDLLLSTPALRALKGAYPESRLSVLVSPRVGELAKRLTFIDTVHTFHANWKMLSDLRKEQFDLAINMRTLVSNAGAIKMRALIAIIGAKMTAGRDTEGRGSFFDVSISETALGDKYEMEYDIELVEKLGAVVTDRKVILPVSDADRERVSGILSGAGIGPGDIVIGIHPGGKPSHRWPIGSFAGAMNAISKKVRCAFVITGEAAEKGLADGLTGLVDAKVADTTGSLDIGGLAALIERCALYISNDTAAMHIAAAKGVNLVAIFGPGYLKRFDPRTISPNSAVIYKAVQCTPCDRAHCPSMKCLNGISAQEVAEAALRFFNK
jgi:heptosyltransferase-2